MILGILVYRGEKVCRVPFRMSCDLDLKVKGQTYNRIQYNLFLGRTFSSFHLQLWYLVAYHGLNVLWPWPDLDLKVKGQTYNKIQYNLIPGRTFSSFDLQLWYLAYLCIVVRRCVAYHFECPVTLTSRSKVKLIIESNIISSWAELFRLFTYSYCVAYHFECPVTLTSRSKVKLIIKSNIISSRAELFRLLTYSYDTWHTCVSWWEGVSRTISNVLWPWPQGQRSNL